MRTVEQAVAEANFGKPSAVKRGRITAWPYVPILDFGQQAVGPLRRTSQILGKAFATRDEAVSFAAQHIQQLRDDLARRLREPRHRALRLQHGLPQEAADLAK